MSKSASTSPLAGLLLLSLGHFITDLNQGALPAFLPFLKEALGLSYTATGMILLVSNLTSSLVQPLFGYLSDKKPIGILLPAGVLFACLGFGLTGLAPSYIVLLSLVTLAGFGVAAFHPEGFKTASFFTGEKKVRGMSWFAVGGNLGFALGPGLFMLFYGFLKVYGTVFFILPGLLLGAILYRSLPWLTAPAKAQSTDQKGTPAPPLPRRNLLVLVHLILIVTMRSWIQMGLVSFIPFYYINYLRGDPWVAGRLVSLYLLCGVGGTLFAAPLADRIGHKRFLTLSFLLSGPLLWGFLHSSGIWTLIFLGVSGFVLIASFSLTVVMAQTILPHHLGIASGLMVGFAIGTGGIGVTLLGAVSDYFGVPAALKVIVWLPWVGLILSLLLAYPPLRSKGPASTPA